MDINALGDLQIFQGLTPEELEIVDSFMEEYEYPADTVVFERDDPGGTMFVVVKGLVEINARIGLDLEKALANVPPGAVFGELSLFTLEPRSARAMTLEDTLLLAMDTPTFERMVLEFPGAGSKLLRYLTTIISDRLRNTTDMYRQALEWSLSVSGAMDLHLDNLITDSVAIAVHLTNGQVLRGHLVKIEANGSEQVFLLRDFEQKFHLVPYHAITSISFDVDAPDLPRQQDLF